MYTNISNIIDTVINLLEINSLQLNTLVQKFSDKKNLTVLKGMRNTMPASKYPVLEIEPTNASNEWATTRAQRPTYNLNFTLTTSTEKEEIHVKYIATIVTALVALLTSPENLQMTVLNETRWDPIGGLVAQVITDSLVTDVTYNSFNEGTIRTAEFQWFALIHEPYPQFKFAIGESDQPTILKPIIVPPI